MSTMRAAVLVEPSKVVVKDVPMPEFTDERDVIIQTEVGSICGSDLHQIFHEWKPEEIRPPGFPCHETVGVVVESRNPDYAVGQRVLGVPPLIHAAGFAPYQAIPSRYLIKVDDDLSPQDIVLAQQLGTTIYAFKKFWDGSGSGHTAVVLGAGSAGLGFTTVCRMAGFDRIIVSDLYAPRTAAAEKLGATTTVTAGEGVVEKVLELTDGVGADLVIEAAGRNKTRLQAFEAVKEEGRIGWFGMNEGQEFTIPFPAVFRRKPTISMRWNAQDEKDQASFRTALDWIRAGEVDTAAYAFRDFAVDDIDEALRVAQTPEDGFIKGGVVWK